MPRLLGILFGLFTHAIFFCTVWKLAPFLYGSEHPAGSLWIDAVLATQFAVIHSVLLLPAVKRQLTKWIPAALYGCFFCTVTCLTLLLAIYGWRGGGTIWQLHGAAKMTMNAFCIGAWAALLYSLYLTGLGYQTGYTPWSYWIRGKPVPRREFEPRGVYRWIRHPVYLGFLGLIWFTPHMTYDHAVLTVIWSVYIFVGSYLKDERLAFYLGETYRRYQAEVTGFPLLLWGPLARRRLLTHRPSKSSPQETIPAKLVA